MSITVRKPEFNFNECGKSYWYDDNKFATCFFSALSVTFPAGEKFFIKAVRDNLTEDMPQDLLDDVKAFMAQEGQHSMQHIKFNDWLDRKGFPACQFERHVRFFIAQSNKLPAKQRLAITCALEHITALMAERLIDEQDLFAKPIHESFREFWMWHALEEEEHKSVAFDVYRQRGYDDFTRIATAIIATIALFVGITIGQVWFMFGRKDKRGFSDFFHGLSLIYGISGFVTRGIPAFLKYFDTGFHPNDRVKKS